MASSQPFAHLICSDHESPDELRRQRRWRHCRRIRDYWQDVGGYLLAREKAACSNSSSEEVHHPLADEEIAPFDMRYM